MVRGLACILLAATSLSVPRFSRAMSAVIASPTAVLMGVENKHGAVKVLAPAAAAAAAAATAVSNMMPIALMPAAAEVETASMVEVGCCEQQLTVYRSRPVPPPKPASLRGRPLCAMSSSAAPPWPTADNEEEQGDDLSDMVVGPLREVICEHHVCNGCIVNSRLPRSQSLDANLSRQQHQQQLQRTAFGHGRKGVRHVWALQITSHGSVHFKRVVVRCIRHATPWRAV